ncbi:MAG: hypothetical protein WCJ35_29125, partial [Planctomycetota bacterium]
HPAWGVIALSLRSMLYVRRVDVPKLAEKYGWEFRTKHQLGVVLLTWFMQSIHALYTLVELCCWDVPKSELADRRARSWDNPDRRPSHADRRRWICREMLRKKFLATLPNRPDRHKFRTLFETLIALVT